MASTGGRHEAQVEFYTARQFFDQNLYCIQARFISVSTPGADRITWGGRLYKTERFLNLEGITLEEIGFIETATQLGNLYEDQPLTDDASAFLEVSRSCDTCRGGTIQTAHDFVNTRLLKVPTIFARGEHTFVVGDNPVALASRVDWTMPIPVAECDPLNTQECALDAQETIENELSEDIDTGLFGNLANLIGSILALVGIFE